MATIQLDASFPSYRCRYHAFLSFRGEDTRKGFTDHLYRALELAGIHTFRDDDDDEVERGANVEGDQLEKAIQESRVSIIVFSKNYASSRWCLDELVKIMKRRKTDAHMVLPVFYDVDPSNVRKQTESFAQAFTRHEECFKEDMNKVDEWRRALTDAADLAGMVLGNRYESELIDDIVEVIGKNLDDAELNVAPYAIGIDNRVLGLNRWLENGSKAVDVAVIYGMGGIGKTTMAKAAYNLNVHRFQGSSFLANIRATSEQHNGLVRLQRKLLSDIEEGITKKLYKLDEGVIRIRRAVSCKRVLIVLDDVNDLEQYDAIFGMREWFYPGSKIIITTRHEHLLRAHEGNSFFNVPELNEYESLELCCWHAFGRAHPIIGYEELSRQVALHCGGLPLALQVLGSSLSGKSVDVWKSALQKLHVIPDGQIQKILKISFDSLHDHEKSLFLHIACFFLGKRKYFTITVLDNCDFFTMVGIQKLVERCLLVIDGQNKLAMHQLLRDMARGIIREESPDPGKRSRVWDKDAYNILRKFTGTETIKALMLDIPMLIEDESSKIICSGSDKKRCHVEGYDGNCSKRPRLSFFSWKSIGFSSKNSSPISNEVGFKTDAFRRMYNLELLLLNNVKLSGGYEEFPKDITWLYWRGFPLKSIPANFHLENLVALDFRNSSLRHAWTGTRFLPGLKIFNLSHSHGLITTPDLSGLPNLERLILKDCINLVEVDESIGDLEKLVFLNLKDCKNLMKLPVRISTMRSIQKLILSGCSKLVLPANMVVDKHQLQSIASLLSWKSIWSWLFPRKNLEFTVANLPRFLGSLSLACCNLSQIPSGLSSLSSLKHLNLSENPIWSLPENMKGLIRLQTLLLDGCTNLVRLPELPPTLLNLQAWDCTSLERVTNLPHMFRSLGGDLMGCEKVVEVQNLFNVRPLTSVDIEMIKHIGFFNSESTTTTSTEVTMTNYLTRTTRKGPLQVLEEGGIFSIFLHGGKIPDWFCYRSMGNSVLSIIVPSHLKLKIRGLNACVVYGRCPGKDVRAFGSLVPFLKVSNETKSLKWTYFPVTVSSPEENEDMLWFSHWRFVNNELEGGEEIRVSLRDESDCFLTKEFGVQFVYEEENTGKETSPWRQNVIAGDVSAYASKYPAYIKGEYVIGNHSHLGVVRNLHIDNE